MVIEGKVFNDFPRFIGALIVEFAVGGAFNLALKIKGDMIIENLNLKPTIDAMMRDFLDVQLRSQRRHKIESSRFDLSQLRPDAVVNFLTPSLDRLRRRHFVIETPSPRSVCTILQEIWCRRTSSGSSDGIVAITSKLDSLRRDMNNLKENMHAIQVGCGLCRGTHLDKECPLNEEVKVIEEVKYGEFGRSFPNIGGNRSRYRMGPPGYYMRIDNRPPFGERKSLEETIYKYLEESAKKQAEHDN
ncbi:hypothetical protein Tco_0686206 [Tanacetum coccineum]